jgi:hypothetical protein
MLTAEFDAAEDETKMQQVLELYERKEYRECISAALKALEEPDVVTDAIPGCNSLHAAVTAQIVNCYEKLGETARANSYKRMLIGLLSNKVDPQKANTLKVQGNHLLSLGNELFLISRSY